MLFWRLELLVYAGEPITDYGVQVAAELVQLSILRLCLVQWMCESFGHQMHWLHASTCVLAQLTSCGIKVSCSINNRERRKVVVCCVV